MRKTHATRRDFLKALGLAAAGGVAACNGGSSGPGGTGSTGSTGPGGPTTVLVRRDISTLAANDPIVVAYKAGVEAMRMRPDTNPLSWIAQAKIHLDHCPHNNWFFLPWHRAYLQYFEQVCRAASGDNTFALPYWNWTANPQVPAAFWGSGNPLFEPGRTATQTSTANPNFVGQPVIDSILALNDFEIFASSKSLQQRGQAGAGELEARPHNYIHGFVGGIMGTYWSPRDPVFWCHHANIDRLWTEWNKTHANTTDPDWLNFAFNGNFFDPAGNPVNTQVKDLLSTHDLGYRYDTQSATRGDELLVSAGTVRHRAAVELRGTDELVGSEAMRSKLSLDRPFSESIQGLSAESPARASLRLAVEGVQDPENSLTAVRVFVNSPSPSAATPLDDPHFVGMFTFFSDKDGEHAGHSGPHNYLFDAAGTIRRLQSQGLYRAGDPVEVQLVSVSLSNEEAPTDQTQAIRPSGFSLEYVEY